jgi:hypothetical protein
MKETRVQQSAVRDLPFQIETANVSIISIVGSLFFLGSALFLWAESLRNVNLNAINDYGLVSVLPVTFYVALGVLTIGFMLTLKQTTRNTLLILMHILALIVIIHGTPQILYGTLRYSWAWKHVGIVDYIMRHGSVNPDIRYLNAYHNWPGFFALAAFFNVIAGFKSSLSYAGWGPVFFNTLILGALLVVYRTFTNDRRLIWLAAWFFFMTSWVGQDYFSPQAMSYFLYLVVVGIVLTWFGSRGILSPAHIKRFIKIDRIANFYYRLTSHTFLAYHQNIRPNSRQQTGLLLFLIMIFFVLASSHQLTPLIAVSALSFLVIFQVTSERYLPVLLAVITVVWVLFMTVGFLENNLFYVVKSFGLFSHNINANLLNLANASAGQQFVAFMDRGLSASIWIFGFLGFVRRYRSGFWDLPAVLLAVAPFPMLAINAYGGEMLFRVYLFSLPFMTFFAASLFYPTALSGRSITTPVLTAVVSLALLPGLLFAYYGKERSYYFTQNEIAAAQYVFTNAPEGSLIVDGTQDWPKEYVDYEYFNYFTIAGQSKSERLKIINNPTKTLFNIMAYPPEGMVHLDHVAIQTQGDVGHGIVTNVTVNKYPAIYLILTRSQFAVIEMTGVLPADALIHIADALYNSGQCQIVYSNSDSVIFKITLPKDEG